MSLAGATRRWLRATLALPPRAMPEFLWQQTLERYPFLQRLDLPQRARLRRLATYFLDQKEFSGTHGLVVSDRMAAAVAAQASLLLLNWGQPERPETALSWYDDFVGIVLYPADAVAHRETADDVGVVHHYDEVLAGEATHRGPVMLSWPAVQGIGMPAASSVVIHEFAHKIDMQSGRAQGAPPLPAGFMGTASAREAHAIWTATWTSAYGAFRAAVARAERFAGEVPWLNSYAATAPAEFFAVACEAYFVEPERFADEFPQLAAALSAFFDPSRPPLDASGAKG